MQELQFTIIIITYFIWCRKNPAKQYWRLVIVKVALLSQGGRAMLRVIEYFAKLLKVTQGHSKW